MKKRIILLIILMAGWVATEAQITMAEARTTGAGATVTVTGIVINGDELGPIRFVQDATGGLAIYSPLLADVNRGDEITVTGTLKDYNTLLEMDPVTSITVNSTGNAMPAATVLTPDQQAEQYEGMLVRIENVDFDGSGTFERTSYTYTAGGESGQIYINSYDSPLIGMVIPNNEITLVGPMSVYNDTYQVLPRDQFDLLSSSVINLTSLATLSNLSATGFTLDWTTDTDGTTEAFYGNTPAMELGKLSVAGTGTSHILDITGLQSSELIYIQPFSVSGNDTAKSAVQVHVTVSESSGEIKAYFNRNVDPSVSLGLLEAEYLDHTIDDTLINYINRATESIDFTIYNFNNSGISNISDALNAADARGVEVRVIYDGNTDAIGVQTLNGTIGKIASPKSEYPLYGIMHNKFVVFDANASDPDIPVVWTGATNFTTGQINTDPNNVIIIQDQSLAKAFQLEFNEMFGSDGDQPDAGNAKFGPDKSDNTPHNFIIDGKDVECYFSPSDGTHTKILNTIESADHELYVATMLITKTDIGYDIADKKDAGVDAKVLINDYDQYGEPIVNTLKASLGADIRTTGESGIMHHKYMIVDQGHSDSDPILLTGSHNWSSSAQFRNDENTLIIHDQGVANAYYQDFVVRFASGVLVVPKPECSNEFLEMNGGSSLRYDVLFNDYIPSGTSNAILTIHREPKHGTAQVETDKTITYSPESGFNKDIDTITYKVCLVENPVVCDTAIMGIYVNLPVGIENLDRDQTVIVYPNPAPEYIYVSVDGSKMMQDLELIDQSGRVVYRRENVLQKNTSVDVSDFTAGIYFLSIKLEDDQRVFRKIAVD
ncbi:phospholipase D-like domain-containing protein [Bacteroidota bacterium]